ncbi:MAG: hypothetical protein ACTH31_05825 [Pseudoclavibacter sp.]
MKLRAPHYIGIALLAIGVIAVIVLQLTGIGRSGGGNPFAGTTQVQGVVGSEKQSFFEDERVREVFAEHGLEVTVTTSGSWRMASLDGLADNDFAFPASAIAATNIQTNVDGAIGTTQPFFSPMAIATFQPIVDLLEANGVALQDAAGHWQIDMAAYLELVESDTRWNELDGADPSYPSPRNVLITSTDIRTSNSAGMYLALAAYVLNGNAVISDRATADANLSLLERLFTAQGFSGSSSAAPFEDYLTQGMGAVPMVMIYEGQFLEEQLRENSRVSDGMVLAYPTPTIFSQHSGVTFSENGEQVMRLLETDPQLAALLAEHGFRPTGENSGVFPQFLADAGIESDYRATGDFVNVAQEPNYEMLDYLLTEIGQSYDLSGAPPATPETSAPEENSTDTTPGATP